MKKNLLKVLSCLACMCCVLIICPALNVQAKKGWVKVQECSPGAPVIYSEYEIPDDPYERLNNCINFLRKQGWSEENIADGIPQVLESLGLPPEANPYKKTPKYTQEQIDAAWEEVSRTDATCTKGTTVEYKNSLTGKTKSEEISEPIAHSYEKITTEPTCTLEGLDTFTCSGCGDSYEEVLPAVGHSYEKVTVDPTCTADGTDTYTCTTCGDSYKESIPALGHSEGEAVISKKPRAFSEGEQTISCITCGEILESIILPQTFPISLKTTIIIGVAAIASLCCLTAGWRLVRSNKKIDVINDNV
ncbi:hypothetical protein [Butyrivibrio sp. YAB3001]|uniref:hypothetical protein n=1 Tax=Butyrivibrio sp. YAB3001 TaxID=1520812 RepID=UPI0008F62283|nr:hypothetical protein [Butyrivibrio sp. YAB3001]SFC42209.1 hypothetical protein SAMN02910398_02222 [Butyrivibrio sp. YAB3001]